MAICSHKSCGRENRVWLHIGDQNWAEVKLHPWCMHCGLVKNISEDRAYKLGYWINILNTVTKHFSIKQVQKRLITKEITTHEFFKDTYSVTGFMQKELFKRIIKKYCNIKTNNIDSLIY